MPRATDNGSSGAIASEVERVLARDLTERAMFRVLTPQGVAKLNRDFLAGLPLEHTLVELQTVLEKSLRHSAEQETMLPPMHRKLAEKFGRPVRRVGAMAFLLRCPEAVLTTLEESSFEEVVEILEYATVFEVDPKQFAAANALGEKMGMPITSVHLAPTRADGLGAQPSRHPGQGQMTFSNHTVWLRSGSLALVSNPMSVWFSNEPVDETLALEIDAQSACTILTVNSTSPPSCLRQLSNDAPATSFQYNKTVSFQEPPPTLNLDPCAELEAADLRRGVTQDTSFPKSLPVSPETTPSVVQFTISEEEIEISGSSSDLLAPEPELQPHRSHTARMRSAVWKLKNRLRKSLPSRHKDTSVTHF